MPPSPIERIHVAHGDIKKYLEENDQPSLAAAVEELFPKALVLAVGSYFEDRIKSIVAQYCADCSDHNVLLESFVTNKAIERQYHTYFDWDVNNANRFFSLFGPDFKTFMGDELQKDYQLEQAISAFLQIGRLRNQLIHQNFALFTLNLSSSEIYDLYLQGERFVEALPDKLRECSEKLGASG